MKTLLSVVVPQFAERPLTTLALLHEIMKLLTLASSEPYRGRAFTLHHGSKIAAEAALAENEIAKEGFTIALRLNPMWDGSPAANWIVTEN